jgi:hypothetical protein
MGRPGNSGFLLTGAGFEFRISGLRPTTYDGLLFVTAQEQGMDHSIAAAGRKGFFQATAPVLAAGVVL